MLTGLATLVVAGCSGGDLLAPSALTDATGKGGGLAVIRLIDSPKSRPADVAAYLVGARRGGGFDILDSLGPDDEGAMRLMETGGSVLGPKIAPSVDATTLATLLRERLRAAYDAMLKGKLEKARADVLSVAESVDRNLEKTAGDPLIWATRLEAYALLGQLETTLGMGTAKARYAVAAAALPVDLEKWSDKPEAAVELSSTLQTELQSARLNALATRGSVSVVVRARGASSIRINGVEWKGEEVSIEGLVLGERYYLAAVMPGEKAIPSVHAIEPSTDATYDLAEDERAPSKVTSLLIVEDLSRRLRDAAARALLARALAVYGQRTLRAVRTANAVLLVLDVAADEDAGWVLVEATSCVRGGECRDASALVAAPDATRSELLERAGAISGRLARLLADGRPAPTSASEL